MKNKEAWKNTKFIKQSNGIHTVNLQSANPRSLYIGQLVINAYAQVIEEHAKGLLLDCGCGHVPYYYIYKDLVDENSQCIDWDNSVHKNEFLDKVVDLNQPPIPYDDTTFDTVLLTDVLEHLSEPLPLIKEISRVLKPNGKLILGVPFFYWIHENPYDYYRYTEFALRKFCTESNLDVISLKPYGGYPDIMLDLTNKYVGRNMKLAKLYMFFARLFTKTSFYRKLRANTEAHYPLGYCLVAQKK